MFWTCSGSVARVACRSLRGSDTQRNPPSCASTGLSPLQWCGLLQGQGSGLAIGADKDVGKLEVALDDAAHVRGESRIANRGRQLENVANREAAGCAVTRGRLTRNSRSWVTAGSLVHMLITNLRSSAARRAPQRRTHRWPWRHAGTLPALACAVDGCVDGDLPRSRLGTFDCRSRRCVPSSAS